MVAVNVMRGSVSPAAAVVSVRPSPSAAASISVAISLAISLLLLLLLLLLLSLVILFALHASVLKPYFDLPLRQVQVPRKFPSEIGKILLISERRTQIESLTSFAWKRRR